LVYDLPAIDKCCGIPAPETVNGIEQAPIEGVSFAYTFPKENADALSRHQTQYFEMMGVQALYHDGWMLSAIPSRAPWQLLGTAIQDPASGYKFELFDVTHDWSQYTDVSAEHPDKVKELHELMFDEFKKYQVFPLDAFATRIIRYRSTSAARLTS
jgi:arylsulfatase A-like enzyme